MGFISMIMNRVLFITEPRVFTNVDNTSYEITAISAKIDNTKEVLIGSNKEVSFELSFYTKDGEDYIEKDTVFRNLKKEYIIPELGIIPVISGLFSNDKEVVYNMAKILSNYYGYTLKPLGEQIFLTA